MEKCEKVRNFLKLHFNYQGMCVTLCMELMYWYISEEYLSPMRPRKIVDYY